jgi:hypothetical protein
VFREFFRKCEISHQTVVFIEATTQIPKSGDKHIYFIVECTGRQRYYSSSHRRAPPYTDLSILDNKKSQFIVIVLMCSHGNIDN